MLTNATIQRIDRTGTPGATGRPRRVQGGAVSIRCCLDMISGRQRYTLGAAIEDATQVVFVERTDLDAASEAIPDNEDQLVILADGASAPHTVTVIVSGDRLGPSGAGLSHAELFVRKGDA